MRLDKFLSDMGAGTRSQVKQKIRKGLVTLDDKVLLHPEQQVDPGLCLYVEGEPFFYSEMEYYMLNKPAGYVSARTDESCQTVLDLLPGKKRRDLFPVGRLDKDTQGLLLITNDGQLAHGLLSPKHHVDKSYEADIRGCLTKEHVSMFLSGLDIGEEKNTLPAILEILKQGEISKVRVTIQEGRFHQVKRMFHTIGCEVLYLKRISMGSLKLDETLKPGEYRLLTEQELMELKKYKVGK